MVRDWDMWNRYGAGSLDFVYLESLILTLLVKFQSFCKNYLIP